MKKLILLFLIGVSAVANACWYNFYNYEDYIFGINNFERHSNVSFITEDNKQTTKYKVTNNMVVDLPISVSMKLTSNATIAQVQKPDIIYCSLQYRVLPHGEWITVSKYDFSVGKLSVESLPSYFLGQNNINPIGLKKDDVIMIRLYVTDGIWQSGSLADKCDRLLSKYSTNKRTDLTLLKDQYEYSLSDYNINEYDLGGKWLPHLVITVIFSGNYRPIR